MRPRALQLLVSTAVMLAIVPGPATAAPTAIGRGGAVASEKLDATQAGLSILAHGGTAADAAVAVASTLVLRHGRPFLATGAAGGATIITTVLGILVNRIDLGMSLPAAIAAPRASQRNSATTQAEPSFIAQPTTAGLEQLGHSFAVNDTSPLDPTITIPPTIGTASGLEFVGRGRLLAAAEPSRRGGGSAGVLFPSR